MPAERLEAIIKSNYAINPVRNAIDRISNRDFGLSFQQSCLRFESNQPTMIEVVPRVDQQSNRCVRVSSFDACVPTPVFHQGLRFANYVFER